MTTLAHVRGLKSEGGILGLLHVPRRLCRCLWAGGWLAVFCLTSARGQDDQHQQGSCDAAARGLVADRSASRCEAPAITGTEALKIRPGAFLKMNVDMVLVPVTVTDPMNRLVTGLEQADSRFMRTMDSRRSAPLRAKMRRYRLGSSSISPAR